MDRFAIVEGYYWWLADHHTGQNSREYARLSRVSDYFKPSPLSNGPSDECSQDVYNSLCDRAKCEHED